MDRPKANDQDLNQAMMCVKSELIRRLNEKGYGIWLWDHETLGIITEEYHELIEAIHKRDGVRNELLDLAVACIFGIVSIDVREE